MLICRACRDGRLGKCHTLFLLFRNVLARCLEGSSLRRGLPYGDVRQFNWFGALFGREFLKKCGGIFNFCGTFFHFFLLLFCIALVVLVDNIVADAEYCVADICAFWHPFVFAVFSVSFALHNVSAVAAVGLNKGWLAGHAACCTCHFDGGKDCNLLFLWNPLRWKW